MSNVILSKTFIIPLHTVSINNFYYGDKRHGIRAEAREWQYKFMNYASQFSKDFAELRDTFDKKLHTYGMEIIASIPITKYYTKKGDISSHVMDISNCEKSIIDLLFLPKYYGTNVPYEFENLNVDDKWLTELISKKRPTESDTASLEITLKLLQSVHNN